MAAAGNKLENIMQFWGKFFSVVTDDADFDSELANKQKSRSPNLNFNAMFFEYQI